MRMLRLWLGGVALVAALGVATVGPALAAQAQTTPEPSAQARTQNPPAGNQQKGWSCPFLSGEQGQAMNEAMQSGDWERMQELMREQGIGQMMTGVSAEAMREHMANVDLNRMQELMGRGDWQGMLDYMREQGMGGIGGANGTGMMGPNGIPGMMGPISQPAPRNDQAQPRQTPASGAQGYGPGAMMGGAQTGGIIGAQGGMMGGSGMMGRR